jgi:uncharacterized membrane protein YgcG
MTHKGLLSGLMIGAIGLLSTVTSSAYADERILSYHSEIAIDADASMIVAETIKVQAEGVNIRRGIYRDFPTDYKDQYGNHFRVGFTVLSVTRDSSAEDWHTEKRANGVRVYAGSADRVLQPGTYTYQIRYRTTRQIGFFIDHDELYWNVTGNGWAFAIDEVSANVTLPGQVASRNLSMQGYVGSYGADGSTFTTRVDNSRLSINGSRSLNPGEGLTLVASWPKGVVVEPSSTDKVGFLLNDNRGLLLGLLALLGAAVYLYIVWSRVGRDPDPGVIFPHYEPPPGYSPASARYIINMGYDKGALSSAIVNLAVKGYLVIDNDDDDFVLRRTDSNEDLAAGESALLAALFRKGDTLELDNKNHAVVSAATSAHKKAIKRDYANQYFLQNTWRVVPSFIGVLLVTGLIGYLSAFTPLAIGMLGINIVMHLIYIYLMKRPTKKGRALMDKLEGFKLYLNVAEKDDLDLKHPPDKTPKLFEQYLPFAIALGVEQAWAEQFTSVFEKLATEQGVRYHPGWYHGDFNHNRIDRFTTAVSHDFNTAISSAATAPGSSSGGGGFSGGGGGGGGGGGW